MTDKTEFEVEDERVNLGGFYFRYCFLIYHQPGRQAGAQETTILIKTGYSLLECALSGIDCFVGTRWSVKTQEIRVLGLHTTSTRIGYSSVEA